jgi:serine/threonine protein kinase
VAIGSLRLTFPARDPTRAPGASGPEAESESPDGGGAEPALAPGGITALMKKLAAAPTADLERAWKHVLAPGAVIGRFELTQEIGRGSFGVVFEAKDRQLGRLVAFKAVRPGRESQVMFREELLQKEAEAVAQLNHPNIVSLYDAGTCEGGPYLIMELLRGETLRDRMKRGRVPLREAVEIAIEIAWALDHAHAAGVVHRDLKPANVFLCTGGRVKVLDFGIAHVFGGGARRAVGTPAYMAPEQWRQTRQDARTDVFGAAATLAEMVTGRLPYRVTKDWSAVLEPDARPHLAAPGAPPQLVALLRGGLSADPDGRPRDGHAWLGALLEIHEVLDDTPVSLDRPEPAPRHGRAERSPRAPTPPPAARPASRTAALVVAGAAAAMGLGALAYLLMR